MRFIQIILLAFLMTLVFSCSDTTDTPIDVEECVEATFNGVNVGEIHNSYLHDGVQYFCENSSEVENEENLLNTIDFLENKFSLEFGISREDIDIFLEEANLTDEDILTYDAEDTYIYLRNSDLVGPLWNDFETGFEDVNSFNELEVLVNSLCAQYQDSVDPAILASFVSVSKKTYMYWNDNFEYWSNNTCGPTNEADQRDGPITAEGVMKADIGGAIMGGIAGILGGPIGVAGGAALSATYASLIHIVINLIW